VQGYLGSPLEPPRSVTIILKHLFLCAVYNGRDFWLLVDNLPDFQEPGNWRGFELRPSRATRRELAWIHCTLGEQPVLEAILADVDVWRSYERMLQRITAVNRSERPATVRRLSVLT
jgi:hypothetical protein